MQVLMGDVTGRPFPALMRDLVLAPFAMSSSIFAQPLPEELLPTAAAGHDDRGARLGTETHFRPELGPGGLWTTPSDLARFAIEVMQAAQGRSKVLSAELARLMLTPQSGDQGFGFELSGQGNDARFNHGGWNDGFKCELHGYAARGQGAIVMSNGEHGAHRLNEEILRSLARVYGWPDFAPVERTTVPVDPALLASYAGAYDPEARSNHPRERRPPPAGARNTQRPTLPRLTDRVLHCRWDLTLTFQRTLSGAASAVTLHLLDDQPPRCPR